MSEKQGFFETLGKYGVNSALKLPAVTLYELGSTIINDEVSGKDKLIAAFDAYKKLVSPPSPLGVEDSIIDVKSQDQDNAEKSNFDRSKVDDDIDLKSALEKIQALQQKQSEGYFSRWEAVTDKQMDKINDVLTIITKQFYDFDPKNESMVSGMRKYKDTMLSKLSDQQAINRDLYAAGVRQFYASGGQNSQLMNAAGEKINQTDYLYGKLKDNFDMALDDNLDSEMRRAAAQFIGEGLLSSKYGSEKAVATQSTAGLTQTMPQMAAMYSPLLQLANQSTQGATGISDKILAVITEHFMAKTAKEQKEFKKSYPGIYNKMIAGLGGANNNMGIFLTGQGGADINAE